MALEFLQNFDTTELLLVVILFLIFVIAVRKVMQIIKNVIWIAVAAVLFPLVANRFLALPIPIDADSILFFVIVGEAAYFIWMGAKFFRFTSRIFGGGKVKYVEKPAKEKKEKFYNDYVELKDDSEESRGKRSKTKKKKKPEGDE